MNASTTDLSPRARLTPGVPTGGVVALTLVGFMAIVGLVTGEDESEKRPFGMKIEMGGQEGLPPNVQIDVERIRREAEAAVRGLDMERLRAAADEARAAAEAARAAQVGAHLNAAKGAAGSGAEIFYQADKGLNLTGAIGDITVRLTDEAAIRLKQEPGSRSLQSFEKDGVVSIVGPRERTGGGGAVVIEVPRGLTIDVADFVGDLALPEGYEGDLSVLLRRGSITAPTAGSVDIKVMERGDLTLGSVNGPLGIRVMGKGDFQIGSATEITLEIRGRADGRVEQATGPATVTMTGAGDITFGRLDGALRADLRGAGSVTVEDGRVSPLEALMPGSASLIINGTAVDPVISMDGSGEVQLGKVEGTPRLNRTGSGTVTIGE